MAMQDRSTMSHNLLDSVITASLWWLATYFNLLTSFLLVPHTWILRMMISFMALFNVLLVVHIAAGTVSLLIGMVVLGWKKGNKAHRVLGNIYFYAMLTASLVALAMSYLHPNYFLFIIGLFTAYMLLTGKRYLSRNPSMGVVLGDWLLTVAMLLFGLAFISFGTYSLYSGNSFGIVFLVFGSVGLLFTWQDWRNFKHNRSNQNDYVATHLQRMIGSYIASLTAFLVVNNTLIPGVIAWLLPTVCLTPLIIFWSRKYKAQKKNATEVVPQ